MNKTFPDKVQIMPPQWDTSAGNGNAWLRLRKAPTEFRPKLGMLHFNGGGGGTQEFWVNNKLLTASPGSFDLAWYYIRMHWKWAQFAVESLIREGEEGYRIHYYQHTAKFFNGTAMVEDL